jgi:hypothetical protein
MTAEDEAYQSELDAGGYHRLQGFWSYSRRLGSESGRLKTILEDSLSGALARAPEVEIFRDVDQPDGIRWRGQLVRAIRRSILFFWLQSPSYLSSATCRFELEMFRDQVARIARHFGVSSHAGRLFEHWIFPIRWQTVHEYMWPPMLRNPAIRDVAQLWDDLEVHDHFDIARHGHSDASYREHGVAMGTMVRDKLYESLPLLGGGSPHKLLAQLLTFVSQEDLSFENSWLERMPSSRSPELEAKPGAARIAPTPRGDSEDRFRDRSQMAAYDLVLTADRAREQLLVALTDAFRSQEELSELAREMGASAERARDTRSMAMQLVEEAQQRSALRWLLRAARALRPTSEKLIAVEAEHARRCFDPSDARTADQVRRLDDLIGIIAQLGDDATRTVTDAFWAATDRPAPAWDVVPMSDRVNRAGLICLMAELDGTDPPPLFRFVRQVHDRTQDEAVRTRLVQWLNTVAGHDLSLVPLPQHAPPADPTYVMVRVRPLVLGEGFAVTIWLWTDGKPREVCSTSCHTLDELRHALAQELERKTGPLVRDLRGVEPDKITYEFILPRDLIDTEVDQWEIAVEGLPLGLVHRVVVRSYDRIYTMPDKGWTTKWNAWQSRAAVSVVWFDPKCDRMDRRFKLKLLPANVVSMACADPFPSGAADPLFTVLGLGVPIIMWARRPCGPGTRAQIDALLQRLGDDGYDVRTALLHMRSGAEDNDEACLHTALLWDDPHRCPPDCDPFEDVPTTEELPP